MGNKFNLSNIGNTVVDGLKIAGIAVASAGVFEATANGVVAAEADAKQLVKLGKFYVQPESYTYKVKKGFFKKPETVRINPVTGKMSDAKSGAKPINTKAIKFY